MKKLLLSGVGALALLAVAGTSVHAWSILSPTTNIAAVSNTVGVEATSGGNFQSTSGSSRAAGLVSGGDSTVRGRNSMTTGTALAGSLVINEVNNGCPCEDGLSILSPQTNVALVANDVLVKAVSGGNSQETYGRSRTGGFLSLGDSTVSGRNRMTTGGAGATSGVWNVVNSSVSMTP